MNDQLVSAALAILFVLGLLYRDWLGQIRDWIHEKVGEA